MRLLLAALSLVALGACSAGGGTPSADSSGTSTPSTSSPSAPTSPPASAAPSQGPGDGSDGVGDQPDASGTKACAEVRAGIDDFNTGDLEGTVSHFKQALPLARAQASQAGDDSSGAQDLLAAVRYYATLAPGDYAMASATSPEFAKYKAITLGQCVAPAQQDSPQSPTESPGQSV